MTKHRFNFLRRISALLVSLSLIVASFSACSNDTPKFNAKNPITITVWHYYNGIVLDAFESLVQQFNKTIGMDKGIIVESYTYGSVSELEKNVLASANKDVGSAALPNVFASYADTAYAAEKEGILANLGDYFTESEQAEYADSYIEEGKIGLDGELRIFPIAKSTEIFMLNDTDWKPFAEANNLSYDNLTTLESLAAVSKQYYEWTDALTPDVSNNGKAFYGRDSIANMFIIGSMEFGEEIFRVEGGKGEININKDIMRKFWDYYYVPYISGYFSSYGRYRSDDVKTGEILAYIGSTSSSEFFPSSVTVDDLSYPIDCKIMPVPHFENSAKYLVQQGAGMVVTKGEPLYELASAEFIKWFTDVENNTVFSAMSGYMPVKKEAISYEFISGKLAETGQSISLITDETLRIALAEMSDSKLYTNKAFEGGAAARNVLSSNIQNKAIADREAVTLLLKGGASLKEAVAGYISDEKFNEWLAGFETELQATIK
jgi:multiple sugar transport system substrate-binding protein